MLWWRFNYHRKSNRLSAVRPVAWLGWLKGLDLATWGLEMCIIIFFWQTINFKVSMAAVTLRNVGKKILMYQLNHFLLNKMTSLLRYFLPLCLELRITRVTYKNYRKIEFS